MSAAQNGPLTLWQNPGWGSAIVEMQAAYYGLPLTLKEAGDVYDPGPLRSALAAVNPLCQIPTLVLPGGEIVTESAAITLLMADLAQSDALVPGPADPNRAAFLRWLIFLVAAIYPTFVYGDSPARFVPEDQAEALQARMMEERSTLWRLAERQAAARGGPWFLGSRLSALDLYLAAMVHWRPREAWFAAECPTLMAAAQAAARLPGVAPAYARNFG